MACMWLKFVTAVARLVFLNLLGWCLSHFANHFFGPCTFMRDYVRDEMHKENKGPSIKYVRKNLGFFDPHPPLVHVCTIWRDPP